MPDRDLLEIFDAVLPRLEPYGPGCVPEAGAAQARAYEHGRAQQRVELGIYVGATGVFGLLTWLFAGPWLPIWFILAMSSPGFFTSVAAARRFVRLAFGHRVEHALPSGTDAATARLEDGAWSLVRTWNADVFVWNGRVEALRLEVAGWQALHAVPEARGIEWTEAGSRTQAEGLLAAMEGLAADRAALVARKEAIEHRLRNLDARLRQLEAAEEDADRKALPAPAETDDDDTEDG